MQPMQAAATSPLPETFMLTRLTIRSRLLLTIVFPLLTIIGLALVAFPTFQTVKINGPQYDKIRAAKDIEADILPPPAFAIESILDAGLLADSPTKEEADRLKNELTRLRAEFTTRHQVWQQYLKDGDPLRGSMDEAQQVGVQLYDAIDADLLPLVDSMFSGPTEAREAAQMQAREIYRTELLPLYQSHKRAIDESVVLSNARQTQLENDTKSLITSRVRILVGVALLLFAAVGFIASAVARSINRPIRALTLGAQKTATEELPSTVARIQAGEEEIDTTASHSQFSNDKNELGELARAFDAMHDTALDLAADQARIRRNVSDNLVNIGRRNQSLLKRSLSQLTKLEQDERDPGRLEQLFKVDHLTMRMRRNAESLLVLADAESARVWSQPLDVADTVRSALSQIEAYDRVELGRLDMARLRGYTIQDVAHILAELLENATYFSPPSTKVTVTGRMRADGYLMVIADDGVGMTPEEYETANRRLSKPTDFDADPTKVLGHMVVGRLASRHGIQVRLTESATAGVSAQVLLPTALLDTESPVQAPAADVAAPGSSALPPAAPLAPVVTSAGPTDPGNALPVRGGVATMSAAAGTLPVRGNPSERLSHQPIDPSMEPKAQSNGTGAAPLARRVKGAQLPDTGPSIDAPVVERDATQVRSALSALQRGVGAANRSPESESPLATTTNWENGK